MGLRVFTKRYDDLSETGPSKGTSVMEVVPEPSKAGVEVAEALRGEPPPI
jgi:hypothetical protein